MSALLRDEAGSVAPFAWLVRDALPSDEAADAVTAAAASYLDSGLAPPDVPDALCATHWLPLEPHSWPSDPRPSHTPRHALEEAVIAVACAASRCGLPSLQDSNVLGCEWWLQEQWPDDLPKEWHTDKAVGLVSGSETGRSMVTRQPLLSSVFYLCDRGGPTAVFASQAATVEQMAEAASAGGEGGAIRVSLAFPRARSLLLFDGSLLHAVLHPPDAPLARPPTEDVPRRTLLVNFWEGGCPPGATDEPLPSLSPPAGEFEGVHRKADLLQQPSALPLSLGVPFARDADCWSRQQLPPTVAEELQSMEDGPLPLVTIHYARAER